MMVNFSPSKSTLFRFEGPEGVKSELGIVVLCTGAGGPEPEFCPILPEPELEPEFVHLRQNSGCTYLCCKRLS